MTLNDAFNDLQAAFADLTVVQKKIEANRAASGQLQASSDEWADLDKAFNALQMQWDECHNRFKSAMKKFNALITSTINQVDGQIVGQRGAARVSRSGDREQLGTAT